LHWRQAFGARSSSGVARANEDKRMIGSASRERILKVLMVAEKGRRIKEYYDRALIQILPCGMREGNVCGYRLWTEDERAFSGS